MKTTVVLLVAASAWLLLPPPTGRRLGSLLSGEAAVASLRPRWWRIGMAVLGRLGVGPATRRRHAQDRARRIQALGALAAELESGQPPAVALARAGGRPPVWPHALGAARFGGDVADALEVDANGSGPLRQVAACWRIAAEGAGLAVSVAQVAASARAAEDIRVEMEGQLAGPRATARMLSVLPVVGLGFGLMLGSDPVGWLVGSTVGRVCLAGAIVLTVLGTWWTGRIAAAVERRL